MSSSEAKNRVPIVGEAARTGPASVDSRGPSSGRGRSGASRRLPAALVLLLSPAMSAVHGAVGGETPREADVLPPGLVLVPGGRTHIGIDANELRRLLEGDPRSLDFAGTLSAETPEQEIAVDSFFLMTTEVTNEQYAAYVRATGARATYTWGGAAIAEGRAEYVAELEARRAEAQAAGRPAPDAEPFDARAWWNANGQDKPYSIPAGDELRPAVFVDWSDAVAYARWAGLRLPTEFEYQRAVRGDTTRRYPWGDEWDNDKFAATSQLKKKGGAWIVGSFPLGATKQGVFDLAGNVWEWTSSPFLPYAGYKLETFTFGFGSKARQVSPVADWNEAQRVVVGGSFQNASSMARATTRRPADVGQSSDALGFRCAASVTPGFDLATDVLAGDLTVNARPREDGAMVVFAPSACVSAQAWDATPSGIVSAPEGYAVIRGERHVVFTPVKQIAATDLTVFERMSLERPATELALCLGFFTTNVAIQDPALEPGTYLVGYRARGARRNEALDASKDRSADVALGLDPNQDWIVYSRLDGTPVRAVAEHIEWVTVRPSRARVVEPEAAPQTDASTPNERVLRLEPFLATKTSRKGLAFTLTLRFAPGVTAGAWRLTQ